MITEVKYFYEKTDQDYEMYGKLWDENRERFVFLGNVIGGSAPKQQRGMMIQQLTPNKDILAIRFPKMNWIHKNKIINDILLGRGFIYKTQTWYPKEIWIYNPMV